MKIGNIAIITARGGSARVPRKNCRLFCGRPMVEWPVTAAVQSGLFGKIIISTDDDEIAACARAAGAEWLFRRPAGLADAFSTTTQVLRHDLEKLKRENGFDADFCCCLYGTSAMVRPEMLQQAKKKLTNGTELVMAVIRYSHPIERALQFDDNGLLQYRQPEFVPARTQDIRPSWHDAGLFYFFDIDRFMNGDGSFVNMKKTGIEVSPLEVVDIDTEEDWGRAEMLAFLNCNLVKS